jgi:hypothetical protein
MLKKTLSKNLLAIFLFVGIMMILPDMVSAHAPSSLQLSYEIATETLTVEIFHSVSDNTTHYINKVEIWKNNMLNQTHDYASQPTLNQFSYTYDINASAGDELKVKATCNIFDDLTRTLVVGETPTDTVAASYACMTILALLSLGVVIKRRNKD